MRNLLYIAFSLCTIGAHGQILVSSTVNHREDIDAEDLATANEAGEDLVPNIESISNFTQLDIYNVALTKNWKVTVSRQDINWHPSLSLYIKRTGSGSPEGTGVNPGSPAGYLEITSFEEDFIIGQGVVTGIECQIQIQGLSVTLPVDAYSTDVIYTLYGD